MRIWFVNFLLKLNRNMEGSLPGGLSPTKPATAEVQGICDAVTKLRFFNIVRNKDIHFSKKADYFLLGSSKRCATEDEGFR